MEINALRIAHCAVKTRRKAAIRNYPLVESEYVYDALREIENIIMILRCYYIITVKIIVLFLEYY